MKLEQLHVDILYEIFKFLSVLDIDHIQRVSTTFNEFAGRHIVWRNAYRFTTLPRPSGPHPWQDRDTLKRVLIRSAKLEKNWPNLGVNASDVSTLHSTGGRETRVYTPLSTRKFTFPFGRPSALAAVGDRWIVVVTKSAISCVDLESTEIPADAPEDCAVDPIQLYQCAADSELQFAFCLNSTDKEGREVVYVVAEVERGVTEERAKAISIFKLRVPTETEREYRITTEFKSSVPVGKGTLLRAVLAHGLLLIHVVDVENLHRFWLVHVETNRLYQMTCAEKVDTSWLSLHLCSTHIMMIQYRHDELFGAAGSECYIEAYPLPTLPDTAECDDSNDIPEIQLHLSHTGICPASLMFSGPVLWECGNQRALNGHAGRVVLVAHRTLPQDPQVKCLAAADLLLEYSPQGVGTITCTLHDIFTPPTDPDSDSQLVPQFFITAGGTESRGLIECSLDGGVRAVFGFTISFEPGPDDAMHISFCAGRLQLPQAPLPCFSVGFAGNTGRILRRHPMPRQDFIEIIDFA
ncbi:hypothetical protein F5I97DRAFT_1102959 [Phlebopus sp. FC_14]|nr:hypothetical protein F5I97DRAFT_1102959 [Phlebopus sp. FC_14]